MKNSTLVGALLLSSLAGLRADQSSTTAQKPILPAATAYRVVELGANHRVWQHETYEQGPAGQVMTHVHSYTELASGMNYLDANDQWTESKELIEAFANGAVARQGQYQVIFADNLNSAGAIDMQTPDGKRLRSNILGLMYVDTATGDAALIAQIQDSTGELISSNQVLYPNAFEGVKADVQYTYKRGSFEQDVILREQPPLPDAYGMNPETTELEVLTEFIDPPAASVSDENAAEPGLEADQSINWGATRLGRGKAFNLGGQDSPAAVSKRYLNLNGRHFLLEKVMLRDIAPSLSKLPEQSSNRHPLPGLAFRNPVLPKTPPARTASRPIRMAAATPPNQGYVLDYVSLNTAYTNYTFRGDVTYYLSGTLTLSGTNTFEGGTVIKYSSYSGDFNLTQSGGALNCKTGPYRPAIFTIKDDNSVGETISGSSGNPAPMRLTDDDVYYLKIDGVSGVNLHDLRMAYGFCALALNACTNALISDVQILHANCAVESSDSPGLIINNALIYDTFNAFALSSSQNLSCINVTFDQCYPFANGVGASVQATNCIFVNVTNASGASLDGNFNGFYNTSEFGANAITNTSNPFQKVGAGNYYLASGSGFQNAGTTNIDATLLAGLGQRTTYPPIVYSNVTITAATLSPQAQRDTDTPDLGYHYDPLDYVFGGCDLYTNLTLTAGTAVGSFECYGHLSVSGQPYGLSLNHGANLISTGTVTQPNWIVYAKTVQEWVNGVWPASGWLGGIVINGGGSGAAPQLNTRFTKWSTLANEGNHFRDNWAYGEVRATHNEFYNGGIGSYWGPYYFTNCLFRCTGIAFWDQNDAASLAFQNCTFDRGGLALCRYSGQSPSFWNIQNTAFDGTAFLTGDNFSGNTNYTTFDYNAYNSSNTAWASYSFGIGVTAGRLETVGTHDVLVTNFNWQTSWLGDYYLPYDSSLINKGNTDSDRLGLYSYTTQTNQTKEATSLVDIGYHYVATDANGLPLDTNGDGIPDYLEDANGNGIYDAGEPGTWNAVVDGSVPAAWYTANGLNASDPTVGIQDPDLDGLLNQQEYLYGTDPNVSQGFSVWIGTPDGTTSIP